MFVRRTKYVKATKRRKGRKKKIVKNSEKVRYVTEREYKTSCDPYRSRGVDVHVKARKRRRGGRRGWVGDRWVRVAVTPLIAIYSQGKRAWFGQGVRCQWVRARGIDGARNRSRSTDQLVGRWLARVNRNDDVAGEPTTDALAVRKPAGTVRSATYRSLAARSASAPHRTAPHCTRARNTRRLCTYTDAGLAREEKRREEKRRARAPKQASTLEPPSRAPSNIRVDGYRPD